MKISCPNCAASGTIPDHEVPDAGRFLTCPRCKQGFTVTRPRPAGDVFLVDTCPSCSFSTFGEETFSACPKCGVVVKAFIERRREEEQRNKDQALLARKFGQEKPLSPVEPDAPPAADFLENLHPVNLVGWGVAAAAIVILGLGFWGLLEYDAPAIQRALSEQREEQVSSWYVFIHYGIRNWIEISYGLATLLVSIMFLKHLKRSLKAMSWILWTGMALVPLSYGINFVLWILEPTPHSIGGYFIEIFNIVFMSALAGIPLFLLERYLHDRKITKVVVL